jgi:hypothetical protein
VGECNGMREVADDVHTSDRAVIRVLVVLSMNFLTILTP